MAHDAIRASSLLREIFANDRTRVGFLIGAGCPFSIDRPVAIGGPPPSPGAKRQGLIPDIAGLTVAVREVLAADQPELLTKLDAFLTAQGAADANVEVILSKVRTLSEIVGNGIVYDLSRDEITSIETCICGSIAKLVSVELPTTANGYQSVAKWIKGLARTYPVEIFTTNYDLLMECALEREHVSTFDGFTGSYRPFFDLSAIERDGLPSHWVRVWKLHGSVNWREVEKTDTEPSNVYRGAGGNGSGNSVIHPSNRKYDQSRRLPYLALIDRLKVFIRKPSAVLMVSGYSFGDEHINEVLVEGLENNPTAVVIATVFGRLGDYPVLEKLARRCSNLTVMAEDLAIVGKKKDAWTHDPEQGVGPMRLAFDSNLPDENWLGGNTRLLLGNFRALGEFIEDISGTFKQVERAAKS